jgi:hypothetical protein
MVAPVTEPESLDKDHARAIASLAEKLHLPLSEVRLTYLKEVDRLKSQARIGGFVEVLAVSSTRSVLRSGKKSESRS